MPEHVDGNQLIGTTILQLEKAVAMQEERVQALETRLGFCLADPSDIVSGLLDRPAGQSPMYRSLYSLLESVTRNTHLLEGFIDRIEL